VYCMYASMLETTPSAPPAVKQASLQVDRTRPSHLKVR